MAVNFINRLVSNDDENEEEEEDVAEDAMRVFEDFLCAEETFAICEHEMCVDAVVDANMFVFDRDVYISGLFFVLNFTRNE